jgi:hypothetical protein
MLNTASPDPLFLAWALKFGYTPWQPSSEQEYPKFARYWLAWQAGIAPDCKLAFAVVRLSGLLSLA